MGRKPKLPRKISITSLNKMTGAKLKQLGEKLNKNRSSLWGWGFTENKLSTKQYVKHKVRVDILISDVNKAIERYWRGSKGQKARARKTRKRKR